MENTFNNYQDYYGHHSDDICYNIKNRSSEIEPYFKRSHSVLLIVVYYVSTLIISFFIGIVLAVAMGIVIALNLNIDLSIFDALTNTLTYIVTIISLIPFCIKQISKDLLRSFKVPVQTILMTVAYFLLFFVVTNLYYQYIEPTFINFFISLNIIDKSVVDGYLTSGNQAALISMLQNPISAFILLPAIVIIGPITEEIVFRKALFRLINCKSKLVTIIITGTIFASIHMVQTILVLFLDSNIIQNGLLGSYVILELTYGIGYFLSGVLLGTTYVLTGHNILPVTIVHILNNLIAAIEILSAK